MDPFLYHVPREGNSLQNSVLLYNLCHTVCKSQSASMRACASSFVAFYSYINQQIYTLEVVVFYIVFYSLNQHVSVTSVTILRVSYDRNTHALGTLPQHPSTEHIPVPTQHSFCALLTGVTGMYLQ